MSTSSSDRFLIAPRQEKLQSWLKSRLDNQDLSLTLIAGDASFRHYFRVSTSEGRSYIAMDAPPEKEDSASFVAIARHWHNNGVNCPEIFAQDLEQGFLLLNDMGDSVLLGRLNPANPQVMLGDVYYKQAIDVLLQIQQLSEPTDYPLPPYDAELLQTEMELFRFWLVEDKLRIMLSQEEHQLLDDTFLLLQRNAENQPQVCVHRDYHSKNLMVCTDNQLGILDFQDAVRGPISYDLVSLLRDCYIQWPDQDVERWRDYYYHCALQAGLLDCNSQEFARWFDLMGLQRHLKASGIFARLSRRDQKHTYLAHIPRTLQYLEKHCAPYDELQDFRAWLQEQVMPKLSLLDSTP